MAVFLEEVAVPDCSCFPASVTYEVEVSIEASGAGAAPLPPPASGCAQGKAAKEETPSSTAQTDQPQSTTTTTTATAAAAAAPVRTGLHPLLDGVLALKIDTLPCRGGHTIVRLSRAALSQARGSNDEDGQVAPPAVQEHAVQATPQERKRRRNIRKREKKKEKRRQKALMAGTAAGAAPTTSTSTPPIDDSLVNEAKHAEDGATDIDDDIYVCFGGATAHAHTFNDVHVYDAAQRQWFRLILSEGKGEGAAALLTPRTGHSAVSIAGGTAMLVFGGQAISSSPSSSHGGGVSALRSTFLNDVHVLDAATWTWSQIEQPTRCGGSDDAKVVWPAPCGSHSATVIGDTMYVIGGSVGCSGGVGGPQASVYGFNLVHHQWKLLWSPALAIKRVHKRRKVEAMKVFAPREMHAACAVGTDIVVAGGTAHGKIVADFLAFDTHTNEWLPLGSFPGRLSHSLFWVESPSSSSSVDHAAAGKTLDSSCRRGTVGLSDDGVLVCFGGSDGAAFYGDFLAFSLNLKGMLEDAKSSMKGRDALTANNDKNRGDSLCQTCRGPKAWVRVSGPGTKSPSSADLKSGKAATAKVPEQSEFDISERFGHAAVQAVGGRKCYIVGGMNANTQLDDVIEVTFSPLPLQ